MVSLVAIGVCASRNATQESEVWLGDRDEGVRVGVNLLPFCSVQDVSTQERKRERERVR